MFSFKIYIQFDFTFRFCYKFNHLKLSISLSCLHIHISDVLLNVTLLWVFEVFSNAFFSIFYLFSFGSFSIVYLLHVHNSVIDRFAWQLLRHICEKVFSWRHAKHLLATGERQPETKSTIQ